MIKGEYEAASLGWLVIILVAVGVWALIWGPRNDANSPAVNLEVDGPLVRSTLANDRSSSLGAAITGTVELVDGCILLAVPDDGRTTAIVWPSGTSWDEASQTIALPNGDVVGVGDEVWGGGGYRRPSSADHPAASRLRDCTNLADSFEVAGVNASTDGIRAGGPPP